MKRRHLLTFDEAVKTDRQHRKPCSDCPWARAAFPGWLARMTPEQWLQVAHSDLPIPCHVFDGPQCAGAAIFRANVFKVPRGEGVLQLPADRIRVFSSDTEFLNHHVLT